MGVCAVVVAAIAFAVAAKTVPNVLDSIKSLVSAAVGLAMRHFRIISVMSTSRFDVASDDRPEDDDLRARPGIASQGLRKAGNAALIHPCDDI